MDNRTHLDIDRQLCGEPVSLGDGHSPFELVTTPKMGVDQHGSVQELACYELDQHVLMDVERE